MATFSDWVEGARLRTLPAATAPVLLGTAAAARMGAWSLPRALLALGVALLIQIGVNFANDYSDGVRGADQDRQGPPRLTGGGLAAPRTVLLAAVSSFLAAAVLGLVLTAVSGQWWLIAVGAAAFVAAWFYTGGKHPYGYWGVGVSELFVFVFFGLVATVGTTFTQALSAPGWVWALASATGCLSIALLFVNNIRDIPSDRLVGKKTVAVRLGEGLSRGFWALMALLSVLLPVIFVPDWPTWVRVVLAVVLAAAALVPGHRVFSGAKGKALIPALRDTGLLVLFHGIVVSIAVAWV